MKKQNTQMLIVNCGYAYNDEAEIKTQKPTTHAVAPLYPCGIEINEEDSPEKEDDKNLLLPTDVEFIGQRKYADEDNGVQPLYPPEIQIIMDKHKNQ